MEAVTQVEEEEIVNESVIVNDVRADMADL
jgi:hypothetical protein